MVQFKDCAYITVLASVLMFHPGRITDATWLSWQCDLLPAAISALLSVPAIALVAMVMVWAQWVASSTQRRVTKCFLGALYVSASYVYFAKLPTTQFCRNAKSDLQIANQQKLLFLEKQRLLHQANRADHTTDTWAVMLAVCAAGLLVALWLLYVATKQLVMNTRCAKTMCTRADTELDMHYQSETLFQATRRTTCVSHPHPCKTSAKTMDDVAKPSTKAPVPEPHNASIYDASYIVEVVESLQSITLEQMGVRGKGQRPSPSSVANGIMQVLRSFGWSAFHVFGLLASVAFCAMGLMAVRSWRKGSPEPAVYSTPNAPSGHNTC